MRHTLDTVGKLDWPRDDQGRAVYPDDLRSWRRELGRPLTPPGRDIRCIVSVGMLTEGWDCNTVTHIVGLRPFMSQLLCEQVVGRGLRRRDYEIGEDGKADRGSSEDPRRSVRGDPVQASRKAVTPEAEALSRPGAAREAPVRDRLPRVDGYQQAIRNRIAVDWGRVPPVLVDPMKIPDEVQVKAALPNNQGRPSLFGPGQAGGTRP